MLRREAICSVGVFVHLPKLGIGAGVALENDLGARGGSAVFTAQYLVGVAVGTDGVPCGRTFLNKLEGLVVGKMGRIVFNRRAVGALVVGKVKDIVLLGGDYVEEYILFKGRGNAPCRCDIPGGIVVGICVGNAVTFGGLELVFVV